MLLNNRGRMWIVGVSLAMSSLSSIALVGIPLPWIGNLLIILTLIGYWNVIQKKERIFVILMALFITMSFGISSINWIEYSGRVPTRMTTSYGLFILLRYLNIFLFFASVITVWRLSNIGYAQKIENMIITIGTYSALYGLYVYGAQMYGLPELLPRSRIGTDLQTQSTVFTYQFHRAMGSFREPSHFAEWLMVPFILSLARSGTLNKVRSSLIGLAMLLTGSLTGLLSIIISGLVLLFFKMKRVIQTGRISKTGLINGALGTFLLIGIVQYVNIYTGGAFYSQLNDRISDLLFGGLLLSNRSYVYLYIMNTDWSLFGVGIGNASFDFGWSTVGSFLSIYINILYSLGIIGLTLLILILILPLYHISALSRNGATFLAWAYLSWVISFAVHSEEFNVIFGVTYGLLISASSRLNVSGRL